MSDLLRELLGPIEPSAFFEQHWERSPFAVTSHPPTWCSLMSVERFEEIVNAGGVAWPFIVGAKTEEKTETTAFRKRAPIDLALAHAEGWTLALQAAGRFDASLRRACAELGEQIGALVMANVYLTPAGARGYPPHYDTHDNFLVQLAGRKRWSIWGSPRRLPGWSQVEKRLPVEECARERPLLSVVLDRGDVLYLPRGFVHAAGAEERSLHLTLNVSVVRFADLLKRRLAAWIEAQREDEAARASLCFGNDRTAQMERRLSAALAGSEP